MMLAAEDRYGLLARNCHQPAICIQVGGSCNYELAPVNQAESHRSRADRLVVAWLPPRDVALPANGLSHCGHTRR